MSDFVKHIQSAGYFHSYDCVQLMHISCLLYKLGVIDAPIYMGRYYDFDKHTVEKMARDMLDGHMHIFKDPRRPHTREDFY